MSLINFSTDRLVVGPGISASAFFSSGELLRSASVCSAGGGISEDSCLYKMVALESREEAALTLSFGGKTDLRSSLAVSRIVLLNWLRRVRGFVGPKMWALEAILRIFSSQLRWRVLA